MSLDFDPLDCLALSVEPSEECSEEAELSFDLEKARENPTLVLWNDRGYDYDYISSFNVGEWLPQLQHVSVQRDFCTVELCEEWMMHIAAVHEALNECRIRDIRAFRGWNAQLADRIRLAIKEVCNDDGVFIKLDTRAPKDIRGGVSPCLTSIDVLSNLAQSSRVYLDLCWSLLHERRLAVHVFPWAPGIRPNRELRCFVNAQGQLTAVSHYDEQERWPFASDIDSIVRRIAALADVVAAVRAPCVMDVHVDVETVKLIELNAWGRNGSTGACQFDWVKDDAILNGRSDVVFVRWVGGGKAIEHKNE